jgi:hypothetical protein
MQHTVLGVLWLLLVGVGSGQYHYQTLGDGGQDFDPPMGGYQHDDDGPETSGPNGESSTNCSVDDLYAHLRLIGEANKDKMCQVLDCCYNDDYAYDYDCDYYDYDNENLHKSSYSDHNQSL